MSYEHGSTLAWSTIPGFFVIFWRHYSVCSMTLKINEVDASPMLLNDIGGVNLGFLSSTTSTLWDQVYLEM